MLNATISCHKGLMWSIPLRASSRPTFEVDEQVLSDGTFIAGKCRPVPIEIDLAKDAWWAGKLDVELYVDNDVFLLTGAQVGHREGRAYLIFDAAALKYHYRTDN